MYISPCRLILKTRSFCSKHSDLKQEHDRRTHDGEDDDACEHGGGAVGECDDERVPRAVVVDGVVGGVGDEAAEGQAQREEDLCARLQPHHRVSQSLPLERQAHYSGRRLE